MVENEELNKEFDSLKNYFKEPTKLIYLSELGVEEVCQLGPKDDPKFIQVSPIMKFEEELFIFSTINHHKIK